MENTSVSLQMDGQKEEESLNGLSKSTMSAEANALHISEYKAHKVLGGRPRRRFILNLKHFETHENLVQELFRKSLGSRIPKKLMSLDEKYLRHCLEVIHISASKATLCDVSVNPLDMGFIWDRSITSEIMRRNSSDRAKFVSGIPVATGSEHTVISPAGRWIVGSVMRSNSMLNILRSPLFQQLGDLNNHVKFGGPSLLENERSIIHSEFIGPLSGSSVSLPQKQEKEMLLLSNHGDGSDAAQRSSASLSSSPSVCTNDFTGPSSCFNPSKSQGMLQCVWNGGVPHFTFSVDDQKELYVANCWEADLLGNKALDFVYWFHLKPDGQNEYDNLAIVSDIVGKMRVSTSFSLCPNNSRVQVTEFVLFGGNESHAEEIRTSSHTGRKSRKLSKVMEVLKSGHSMKQRSPSKCSRTSMSCEIFHSDKCQDACGNLDLLGEIGLLESDLPPNLELAAIVVKDHLYEDDTPKEEEVGGWGLKFLNKPGAQQNSTSLRASAFSDCCQRNTGDCSRSMHIIVPAGVHGGPRTRNGGPSSLVERWRLGGQCDCGGWDVGCPLTVLMPSLRRESILHSEAQEECQSFDIYTQGSKQGMPTVKMVNIHNDLYFINFHSTLSALQCFSIAVAIIHSRSQTPRLKHVQ
ncbi:hypothetical protein Ancab_030152 [Ancistrocladus abbreviatus]